MKKLLLILLFSFCLTGQVWAVNYTSDANCQGAWLFTEGSGTTVADSSGNGNTGTFKASGEPAWSATVPDTFASYSVDFDGSNDYINCGDINAIDAVSSLTLLAFVYIDSAVEWGGVLSKSESNTLRVGMGISGSGVGGTDDVIITYGDGSNNYAYTNEDLITTGSFHLWAYVFDGSQTGNDNRLKFYYDGNSKTLTYSSGVYTATTGNSANVCIGAERTDGTSPQNCKISHSACFDRALSSTEINDIMDNGLAGGGANNTFPACAFGAGIARGIGQGMR